MSLRNFQYQSPELAETVNISEMDMNFTPRTANVRKMKGAMGQSDFNISGQITNVLGYLFNNENIRGQFNLQSNTLVLDDFVSEEASESTTDEGLQIPSFLNCSINTSVNTVRYGDLELTGVNGNLQISDRQAGLYGMNAQFLGGKIGFTGEVSTKGTVPVFDIKLNLADLGIGPAFKNVRLLRALAPVAQALEGKLSSEIAINGNLLNDLNLDLNTLTGGALAELKTAQLSPEKAKVLNALAGKLNFLNTADFDLKGLKTALTFENGVVKVAPFNYRYKDIAMLVEGGHSFDAALDYKITLQVPAKYLGTEINNLIAQIGEDELKELTIPVVANVSGGYSQPNVSTDLTSGVKNLTTRLIAIQKQKLVDKGTQKTKDLLEGLIKKDSSAGQKKTDSSNADVRNVVRDIFKRSEKRDSIKAKDSVTSSENPLEKTAKGVFGNLLGRKKKDTITGAKKDSVN